MSWRRYRSSPWRRGPDGRYPIQVQLAEQDESWRPSPVIMADRVTGTRYMLTHTSSTDRASLTTTIPSNIVYRPREPIIRAASGPARLYVSGGSLAYELETAEQFQLVSEPPVFTYKASEPRIAYQVLATDVECQGCPLSLVKFEGLGSAAVTLTELPFGLPSPTSTSDSPAASADDANEVVSTTGVTISGTTIGMQSDRHSGVRFPALAIPRGATIWSASIEFVPTTTDTVATAITVAAELADDAAQFAASNADISGRTVTEGVSWTPGAWTSGTPYTTGTDDDLDFTSELQLVVDQAGYTSSSAIVLTFLRTAGQRIFAAQDHATEAPPVLTVEYYTTDCCTGGTPDLLGDVFGFGVFAPGVFV